MVKVRLQICPTMLGTDEKRRVSWPIGRNHERYQEAVRDRTALVRGAEELKLCGAGTVVQYFQSEGFESGRSQSGLQGQLIPITSKVNFRDQRYGTSAADPLRVAEEILGRFMQPLKPELDALTPYNKELYGRGGGLR